MDFLEAQAQARRRTRRLTLAFMLAILAVVAALTLLTLAITVGEHLARPASPASEGALVLPGDPRGHAAASAQGGATAAAAGPEVSGDSRGSGEPRSIGVRELLHHDPVLARNVALGWLLAMLLPVLWKTLALARSDAVARSLGATLLPARPEEAAGRRLRNVVEEMSIASGVPVPRVFVLRDEPSINALVAGFSPSDATLVVTAGALRTLDRDQLQGVVAHEFSHILNGDMRMNVRLIAWMTGLLGLAALPWSLARRMPGSKMGLFVLFALWPLMAIGQIGAVTGRLLQAAISRQREWLADASAVQFTRNPDGLRRALVAVERQDARPRLGSPAAQAAAHLFFAPAVRRCISTHPPLRRRIAALASAPAARLSVDRPDARDAGAEGGRAAPAFVPLVAAGSDPVPGIAGAPADLEGAQGAMPYDGHAREARARLDALPSLVLDAAEGAQAEALLLALVLADAPGVQQAQRSVVERALGAGTLAAVLACRAQVRGLPAHLRLPAVQHLFPKIRALPPTRRAALAALLSRLALADARLDLFEFCVTRLASTWLRDGLTTRPVPARRRLTDLRGPLGTLLSLLAVRGHPADAATAEHAFVAGAGALDPALRLRFEPPPAWADALWHALDRLDALVPRDRRALVAALCAVVRHDGRAGLDEVDLMRTVCAVLHCPLPLLEPPAGIMGWGAPVATAAAGVSPASGLSGR